MGFDLKRFDTFMSKGLSLFTPDFTQDYSLAITSTNMLSGIRQGMGPRFGMSPIPGHCHTAAKAWSGGSHGPTLGGLMQSEGNGGFAMTYRNRFFGMIPIRLADTVDPSVSKTFFAWLTGNVTAASAQVIDIGIGSEQTSYLNNGSDWAICTPTSDIVAAIPPPSILGCFAGYILQNHPALSLFYVKSFTDRDHNMEAFLSYPTKYYLPATTITVSGKDVPQANIVGAVITQGSATVTAFPNFVSLASNLNPFGVPSWFNTKNYPTNLRTVNFQTILDTSAAGQPAGLIHRYEYKNHSWNAATALPATNQVYTGAQINVGAATAVTGRADAVALTDNAADYVFLNDPENTTNSAYSAILAANGNAIACILQPWNANADGTLNQWCDLTNPVFDVPKNFSYTEYEIDIGGTTYVNGVVKATSWANWFKFTRGGVYGYSQNYVLRPFTFYVPNGTLEKSVTIGENGSGILRGGLVYEFAYSLYNKRLNFETNVGLPAKLQIPWNGALPAGPDPGTAHVFDYVAVSLFRQQGINNTGVLCDLHAANAKPVTGAAPSGYENVFPRDYNTQSGTPQQIPINDTEYRVYYRQEGTFEWLPAGSIDAAEYWYNPTLKVFWICAGNSSGLPGGQPGGFNDYSTLPKDQYTNVLQWRGRVFWMSSKSLIFSMRDNIFAYPLRNSVTCPSGEFRGAIVHAYPGQATQEGRLIIFGSEESYIGRFTGSPSIYPVQVSPTIVGQFPLDGSDFVVERWSTMTAFSSRAAVVADGELFYWGPKGIFHDNGTELPDRISMDLEPAMFTLYDPNKTDEIFAHYFSETKEIFWFYPVKDTTVKTTSALVFNTITGQFGFCTFNCKIDSISEVNIERTDVTRAVAGARRVAAVRADHDATLQRAYFMDVRNKTGDLEPTKDQMIKKVETNVAAGYVRLWIAEGTDSASAIAVVPGDKILVSQYTDYTARTDFPDFVGVVSAVSIAGTPPTGYYDVKLPASITVATPASTTLTANNYMPIWTSRHNTIAWALNGNYWSPLGLNVWAYWLFLHHQYKVNLIADDAGGPTINISSRTPISKQTISRASVLVDNSDGNCQILSSLLPTDQGFEGQAIKLNFSGTYLGHDWTMQYLGVDASLLPEGDFLRMFEG